MHIGGRTRAASWPQGWLSRATATRNERQGQTGGDALMAASLKRYPCCGHSHGGSLQPITADRGRVSGAFDQPVTAGGQSR